MSEIKNMKINYRGEPLDRAPEEVVNFLRLFETDDQPLVGFMWDAPNRIRASYGSPENRREESIMASRKIPINRKNYGEGQVC